MLFFYQNFALEHFFRIWTKKTFEAQCYPPVHEISVILANLSKCYEQNSFFWIFSMSNWVSDIYEHIHQLTINL